MNRPRLKLIFLISLIISTAFVLGFEGGEETRAYLAFTKHQFNEALELYSKIGNESGAGLVMLAQNKPYEAESHFLKANDLSGLGLCRLKRREYQEALKHFLLKNDNRGLGLTYLALKDEQNARDAFSKANDWSGLGLIALAKNNTKEAKNCFQRIQDYTGLGLTALKEKDFDAATRNFTLAKDDSGMGLVFLAVRHYEKAAVYFQKAHDVSGLGYVAMAQGDFKKAEAYFTQVNDKNGLGDLYSQLHQFAKAREMFEADFNPVKVIQSFRNDYTLTDRLQQALNYADNALKDGKMTAEIMMEMADIDYDLKKPKEALALLDQASQIKGYSSEAHLRKGRIYFYLRDLDRSEQEFSSVKQDDFLSEKRYEEAQESLRTIQRYKAILKNNPDALQSAEGF